MPCDYTVCDAPDEATVASPVPEQVTVATWRSHTLKRYCRGHTELIVQEYPGARVLVGWS